MLEIDMPLVSISTLVYNHAPYLRECFEGFVMQKTNFAFEVLVHDDASTDNSAEIIKEYTAKYPNIFKPIYQTENQYSKGLSVFATYQVPRIKGKYIALCEGDDYWTDPLKLQKQVDFLEANPDYGMCYTNFDIFYQDTKQTIKNLFTTHPQKFRIKYNSAEEFVLKGGYVCPPSWMFRKECLPSSTIKSVDGTFVLFTHFLCTTKVHGMEDTTATYRVLQESASHSNDYNKLYHRAKNLLETQFKLIDTYNLEPALKQKCEEAHYKNCLIGFVIHNKVEDIKAAKTLIKNKQMRDRILLFCSLTSIGRNILKYAYPRLKALNRL
ncbi:MAG: glycosyltransferase family 2 protein [Alistipes sp.]|nr:glycosyltransferase family 2 protein [Alistipes sp.]